MVKIYEGSVFDVSIDIVVHQANCFNTMGAGIAKEIKKRYPRAAQVDRMTQKGDPKKLGQFTFAAPDEQQDKWIINLYGQFRYGRDKQYTDYKAVRKGLENIHSWIMKMELHDKTIGISYKMGCVNAGGDWNTVKDLIEQVFGKSPIKVLICKN